VRLLNNWLLKLVAVVIAAVLWAAAQGLSSEERSLDVPIVLEEVPEHVIVVEQSTREVSLEVKGSRAALRRAERQLTRYAVSLRGVEPGEARYAVDREQLRPPRGAEITARSPSSITFRIEPREQKRVPVRVDVVGALPAGYRLAAVRVRPAEVVLDGARRELRRIREVMTDRVDVSGLRQSTVRETRLIMGWTHVQRAQDGAPVQVEIEIEAPEAEGPAEGEGEGSAEAADGGQP
jgi:YbbR domain-containing protein